ncbi:MAG: ABC transporter transmembrane domain-containing protein, partial [Cyanobacteria bacterium J06623_7]
MVSIVQRLITATKFGRDNYPLLREFKYFKRIIFIAVSFTLLAAILEGFGVGFLLSFLQSLTQPDAVPTQTGVTWFDNLALGANLPANQRVYRICISILAITLIRTGCFYVGTVFSGHAQANLTYRLRRRLFEQLQALRLSFFSQARSGLLINT